MNSNAVAFLRSILPETGLYCSWTKTSKAGYNRSFRSIEVLCDFIAAEDYQGKAVYHACASYTHEQGVWNAKKEKWEFRTQDNALGARSFWMDIDGGEDAVKKGTGYADAAACITALVAFVTAAQLPPPWLVASGSGIHSYWPLAHTLGRRDWETYATGLRSCARHFNFKFDPARVVDIASVLRTPGTHNRKREATTQVQCGPPAGPYDIEAFQQLLSLSHERQSHDAQAQSTPAVTQRLLGGNDAPAAYAEKIADHCAHIAAMRDTGGNLPEPLWYAGLGVLAWCVDGTAAAHAWSSGYAGYTALETDGKLERARQLTGATTCQKFESLDHGKCAACQHRGRIKSPISLGYLNTTQNVISPLALETPGTEQLYQEVPTQIDQTSHVPLPLLPLPWKWSRFDQLVMETEKNDASVDVVLSEYPIYLEGVQTGEIASSKYSYHFRQFLPHQGWHDIHIAAEQLIGPGGISKLFGGGAVIHEPKNFLKYVEHAINAYHRAWKLRMSYEQMGWKDDYHAFVYGANVYSAAEVQPAVCSNEVKTRAQWLAPAKGGTLEGWTDAANALFQLGCEAQSFALLCSFAALFTPFHSDDEGGAIVSLVSGDSGSGKTTALAGVSSVWGEAKGLGLTNIDTVVSKGLTLGVLGNLPVVFDEMWNRDPEVIREFVMMFTNGRDKMRGTRDGEIKHTQAEWRTLLVSGSNRSLVELLNNTSAIDAPGMRILEFNVSLPEGTKHQFGDRLKKALIANCGHAGDAYLSYLLQPEVLGWAREALIKWTEEIWHKTQLRSEHRFWVRTLGSVSVAAALVTRLGLLSFQPSRIVEWGIEQAKALKNEAPVTGRVEAGMEHLAQFLTEHIHDTLVVQDKHHQGKARIVPILRPTRQLLIRYEVNPGKIYISEHHLRRWMTKNGVNVRELFDKLRDKNVVLDTRRHITLSAGTEYPGAQTACVEINSLHPAMSGVTAEIRSLQAVRQERADGHAEGRSLGNAPGR